jgi:Zn-dependent protease with chaperone function
MAAIMIGTGGLQSVPIQDTAALARLPALLEMCVSGNLPASGWQRSVCIEYLADKFLYHTGVTLAVAAAIQALFLLTMSIWVGRDPFRLARCFGWVSRLFVTIWSLMSIPRFAIIATILILMLQSAAPQRAAEAMGQKGFLAAIAIYVVILTVLQLRAMFRIRRKPGPSRSLGCAIQRDKAPRLYGFIEDVARRTGTAPPAWLVATIDTNFSITNAPVQLPDLDDPLEGGVISLSLPMMRLLTAEELAGIVAHELGHLADPVSAAKSKWGPPYAALMEEMAPESTLLTLSPNWHLGIVPAMFEESIAETVQQGEANADEAALRVARPEAAAMAFMKVVVAEQAMSSHANINFDRLQAGVALDNLSTEATELALKAIDNADPSALAAHIRETFPEGGLEPSVEQRLANFGFTLEEAVELLARRDGKDRPADVGDLSELERRVSRIVHRFQQAVAGQSGPLPAAEVESMAAFLAR